MRKLYVAALLVLSLTACGSPSPEEANTAEEIAALKKRLVKLEGRVRQLEGRGRPGAPRGKVPPKGKVPAPPVTGPTRTVNIEGDAKAVMVAGAQRRFKLPGPVPMGDYTVMAAFGEQPLAKVGTLSVGKGEGPLVVVCSAKAKTCSPKP